MMVTKGIYDPIDVVMLYIQGNHAEWNKYLSICHATRDVNGLVDTLRRLQAGMDKVQKEKLNTDKINTFFIRLQRSIENTLKKIYREQNINPLYDPKNKHMYDQFIQDKRNKDLVFERFLRKERF